MLINICVIETYSKIHVSKHFSAKFCMYAMRNSQETQVLLKLNGTHQLLAYYVDVNLL
jgi:hypothetical protein